MNRHFVGLVINRPEYKPACIAEIKDSVEFYHHIGMMSPESVALSKAIILF
jgi:hypothetical protein